MIDTFTPTSMEVDQFRNGDMKKEKTQQLDIRFGVTFSHKIQNVVLLYLLDVIPSR